MKRLGAAAPNVYQPTNQPTTILTCAQKRTTSQLSLPHGTV